MTPHKPAHAKVSSCFLLVTFSRYGYTTINTINPITKRKNRISIGEKLFNKIFVAINVVPQIKMVISADK
ncbi:hypothetical protein AMI01nite_45140 [Aneurinibacillus migulanus]|nr:hypothetical protein AMI01nite_45140 [Aneurinibacillus migulanus]